VTCSQGKSAIADYNTQFNISPQVSMIRGRHSFVFGAQLEEAMTTTFRPTQAAGLFPSMAPGRRSLARNSPELTGGVDFADFLLGYGLGSGAAFGNQTTGSLVISGPVSGQTDVPSLLFWRYLAPHQEN